MSAGLSACASLSLHTLFQLHCAAGQPVNRPVVRKSSGSLQIARVIGFLLELVRSPDVPRGTVLCIILSALTDVCCDGQLRMTWRA